MADDFSSSLEGPFFRTILEVAARHGLDPLASRELESYFEGLVAEGIARAEGTDLSEWLDERLAVDFATVAGDRPRWIQSAEWPVVAGRPLAFVGQIDLGPSSALGLAEGVSFFLFCGERAGEVRVVVQS